MVLNVLNNTLRKVLINLELFTKVLKPFEVRTLMGIAPLQQKHIPVVLPLLTIAAKGCNLIKHK